MQLARVIPLAGVLALAACSSGAPRKSPGATLANAGVTTRAADNGPSLATPAVSPRAPESIDSTAATHSEVKRVSTGRSIYFSDNDAALSEESKAVIRQHADLLKQNPKRFIVLRAFLDGLGSRTFSLAIVQKRLDLVVQTFREQGVAKSKIRQIMLGRRGKKPACEVPPCRNSGQRIELLYK